MGAVTSVNTASRPALQPSQLPIQRAPGALSPMVKLKGHEAAHSPPAFAEIYEPRYLRSPVGLHGVILRRRDTWVCGVTQLSNSNDNSDYKYKAILLQAGTGPGGTRRLKLPEYLDIHQIKVVRLSAARTGHL